MHISSAAVFQVIACLLFSFSTRAADASDHTAVDESHFRKVVLATNLYEPIQLDVANDGRVYFAERRGAIKVWQPSSAESTTALMLGKLNAFTGSEDGILGLALDPGFSTNHWLYLYHSTVGVLENRVSRFTVNGESLDLASQKVLLHIPTLAKKPNHSGGCLGFDAHGNLYASTGDYTFIPGSDGYSPLDRRPGREVHDSERTAANSNDPRGKILRIHPEPDGSYTIPQGNLFKPGTPRTLPEIYIMGCRNPFRFTVDPETGWLIWGDVGPDALEADPKRGPPGFDEFNLAKEAGNFGWPYFVANNRAYVNYNFATKESGSAFDPAHPVNDSPNNTGIHELPPAHPAFIWYPPGPSSRFPELGSGARSAMAGPIYHYDPKLASERKFPAAFDKLLFLFDWERSWIKEVRLDSEGRLQSIRPFAPSIKVKRPISMRFGPDGALYVIEWGSAWFNNKDAQIVRIEYTPVSH
jgi:cytochrome c